MKVPLSWIREFVDIDEPAESIGRRMSLRGLALEGLEPVAGGDTVLDFDVTANRPDCMSVKGIAREIAAAYARPLKEDGKRRTGGGRRPPADGHHQTEDEERAGEGPTVTIEAPDLCARFVAATADVQMGPSPAWMQARLQACAVRPISNIVDITNYVLIELGQPMHAYDRARLAGDALVARLARPGEPTTTLDGKRRVLDGDMLVIGDASQSQGIAGVMGGADSEVSAATRQIVLEAAWFKPQSVRSTSRRLGLRTEASMRFERGADITAPVAAMARACELLEAIGAGQQVGSLIDVYPAPRHPVTLRLDRARVAGLLGMTVPNEEAVRILTALGFDVVTTPEGWMVTAPPWRIDVHRDVDLIEELGRHHGFEHLPATFPGVQKAPEPSDPRIARDARARHVALAGGFSEAISFAFIEARHAALFLGTEAPVALANPLSEKFAVMRPSLVPGLVQAVSHNRRHGRRDIQLFEIGTRFSPQGETRSIGLVWTGLATPDHWSGHRRDVDFFDVKGMAEQVAGLFVTGFDAVPPPDGTVPAMVLVPGRAAVLQTGDQRLGWLGLLQPAITDAHDVPAGDAVYVAELDLDRLSALANPDAMRTRPLPRFPTAVRDIAMLVDESLSAATVRGTIRSGAPDTLVSIGEFDRYQGKGIPDGKVSLALRLTFQSPDRTLTDSEVDAATTQVVDLLVSTFGAVRR